MTDSESGVFNVLRGTTIKSTHGGCYVFVHSPEVKSVDQPNTKIGKIYTYGKILNIIDNKVINGKLITDWLGGWKFETNFSSYTHMCDIYAHHILYTHPEPGTYWSWKDK